MRFTVPSRSLAVVLFLAAGLCAPAQITLVKKGKTAYTIFMDPEAPASVRMAAGDLEDYFGKVTGVFPGIVKTSTIPVTPFISLGYTAAAKKEGLDPSGIPIDGFRMVTRGGNLYILGPDTPDGEINPKGGVNCGTSNGVYTFIGDYLGVHWVMPGETGEEFEKIKKLDIPEMDRTEHSPFDFRVVSMRDSGPLEEQWNRRMKLYMVSPMEHNHNWIKTVPPSLYDEHPEWFAMKDGKRIPPIGNYYKLETTNQEMVNYFAEKILKTFRDDPGRRWYSLSPSDGRGWSESPESLALTETDPRGSSSVTPLILTFYNDVAKIVRKEFPDHMLGGYIYGNFRYPPRKGLKVEPNLAFMIPNGPAYGFKLYRPSVQETWASQIWIPEWSDLSKRYGFDIYYYDLPVSTVQPNGIICPPAPDLVDFTFRGMVDYGFKGGYFYGNPVWPAYSPGNYAIARKFWDPDLDAREILHDYYTIAYGDKAGEHIGNLFHLLDTAYANFYNRNQRASYSLTEDHLKEIYAAHLEEIEHHFLKAGSLKKKASQEKRLELLGQVLSLLQWNLRDLGFISSSYRSPLTLSDEEIDQLLAHQGETRIMRQVNFDPEPVRVEEMASLTNLSGTSLVPVNRHTQILMHVPSSGEVSIHTEKYDKGAEFIHYILTDDRGKQFAAGAVSEGRTIRFRGEAGSSYYLYIPNRNASGLFRIEGASVAYNIPSSGFQLNGGLIHDELPLYFYVPDNSKGFNIIMGQGGGGAVAELYAPDGKKVDILDTREEEASYLAVRPEDARSGFWSLKFGDFDGIISVTLDEKLPQWFISDPERPLRITKR